MASFAVALLLCLSSVAHSSQVEKPLMRKAPQGFGVGADGAVFIASPHPTSLDDGSFETVTSVDGKGKLSINGDLRPQRNGELGPDQQGSGNKALAESTARRGDMMRSKTGKGAIGIGEDTPQSRSGTTPGPIVDTTRPTPDGKMKRMMIKDVGEILSIALTKSKEGAHKKMAHFIKMLREQRKMMDKEAPEVMKECTKQATALAKDKLLPKLASANAAQRKIMIENFHMMHHALHKLEEKAKPDEKELFEKLCKVFEGLEDHFPIHTIHGKGKYAKAHGGDGGAVFIKNLAGGRIAIKNGGSPEEEPEPEPKHGEPKHAHSAKLISMPPPLPTASDCR